MEIDLPTLPPTLPLGGPGQVPREGAWESLTSRSMRIAARRVTETPGLSRLSCGLLESPKEDPRKREATPWKT